jgi:hypothetical protein
MAAGDKKKKPAQTEEKAKGLIGLKKGQKVKDAPYSVGNYKGKTLNLTAKQIAKSGVKGAKKAAAAKATSISDTKFEKGKGVTKGGKAFTGTVDLGGGNMAVYVGGKRVRAAAKKAATPTRTTTRSTTNTSSTSTSRVSADQAERRAQNQSNKPGRPDKPGPGYVWNANQKKWVSTDAARAGMAKNRLNAQMRRGNNAMYNNGTRVSMSSASSAAPKDGERRTRMVGNRRVVEKYDSRNKRWLPLTGSRGGR